MYCIEQVYLKIPAYPSKKVCARLYGGNIEYRLLVVFIGSIQVLTVTGSLKTFIHNFSAYGTSVNSGKIFTKKKKDIIYILNIFCIKKQYILLYKQIFI